MFDSATLLIGIGAQKAGTTWLSRYFMEHPEVLLAPIKELHYFDQKYAPHLFSEKKKVFGRLSGRLEHDHVAGRAQKRLDALAERAEQIHDDKSYIEFFRKRLGSEKVFGEITPNYSMLNAATFARMNQVHPQVRFLFVLRDPIERSWSQFCFARRFKQARFGKEEFATALERPALALRSDYKRTIQELEKAVPENRIKLIFFESMFNEQGVREISEFLRIEPRLTKFERGATANRKPPLDPELAQLAFNRFSHVYDFAAERFGDSLPQRWREAMERYGGAGRGRPEPATDPLTTCD